MTPDSVRTRSEPISVEAERGGSTTAAEPERQVDARAKRSPILPLDQGEAQRIARESQRIEAREFDREKRSPALDFETDKYRLAKPLLQL